ncbi:sigma factor-like helix-turn-helix DNA-binding protein [Microbacterium sp. Bi121]|uniref:sigma factor-like helix-turn-helix DNA-binding protein n=1 Tax=Microbacterium sp. Bi121 TaxID=2822348 RepID=UPI001D86163E|nr:sigma factor-like helix-turn-helix DNA-binding protein [Microbacterium sp. Bi121]CAH0123308.1 hypothetical protein SRABI121_00487 [Microbacterium sp. Bi121]
MDERASATDFESASADELVTLADVFPAIADAAALDQVVSDSATCTWFSFGGFKSWSDISCMTLAEISDWPGLGEERIGQLIEDFATATRSGHGIIRSKVHRSTGPADSDLPPVPLGALFPSIGAQTSVERIVSGATTRNAMLRRGIRTWRHLAPHNLDDIGQWSGIGHRAMETLLTDLTAHVPGSAAPYESATNVAATLGDQFPHLDAAVPIERLTNDTRSFNALVAHQVFDWRGLSELSIDQIATWSGIGATSIERLLNDLGRAPLADPHAVTTPRRSSPGPTPRERLMIDRRRAGATLGTIGDEFGISRERVRQIIEKHGGPSPAEVRAAQQDLVRRTKEARRSAIDKLVRPILHEGGAMTIPELTARTGLTNAELVEFWPEDLTHLRIRTAGFAEPTWTDDETYAAIREAALFEFPLTAKAYAELIRVGQVRGPSLPRINQRFGGWAAACDAAQVEHGQTPRASYNTRWTDAELLAYARDYFLDPGWPSSAHRFDAWKRQHASDAPSQQTLRNRFGTWSNVKRLALYPGENSND